MRHQRGERVVGDLRPGRRQRRDQRRLARRREPDQPDVGDDRSSSTRSRASPGSPSSAKPGPCGRATPARRCPARRGRPRRLRSGCRRRPGRRAARRPRSSTTVPSGTSHLQVVAGRAVAVARPAPACRCRRAACGWKWKSSRVCTLRVDDEHDAAAAAAVAAVRAAERLELLAVHRGAAVAAVARARVQHHAVDEPRHALLPLRPTGHTPGMTTTRGRLPGCRPGAALVGSCLAGPQACGRNDVDGLAAALDAELAPRRRRARTACRRRRGRRPRRGGTWCRAGGRGSRRP